MLGYCGWALGSWDNTKTNDKIDNRSCSKYDEQVLRDLDHIQGKDQE